MTAAPEVEPLTDAYPPEPPGGEYGRTPPQDVAAEQSVLGGMLLSVDAIADVIELVSAADFYVPRHETVFAAILDLYGRDQPVDAVTVAAELTRRGDLAGIGGPAYLHTLLASTPTAANAGYYAKIVKERAFLRRLVSAGIRITQLGYATDGGDVGEIANAAQAEIFAATTDGASTSDLRSTGSLIDEAFDAIEAAAARGTALTGVPSGFADLDRLTNGWQPGQFIIFAARPAMGKALALDTPLPTPDGWTTMGEVQVGDYVLGSDGRPNRVVAATEVMSGRPCYRVTFSDGAQIVADAQHEWFTETRASRRSAQSAEVGRNRHRNQRTFGAVRTTEEIAATVRCDTADQRLNHSVPLASALDLPEGDLPVPPYTLGAWLGDGTGRGPHITTADPEILARVEADGFTTRPSGSALTYAIILPPTAAGAAGADGPCQRCGATSARSTLCRACYLTHGTTTALLRRAGVLNDKHIPRAYLRASERQRRALLAGLLDTDGTVARSGTVQITLTNHRLALDVRELVTSLGYRSGWWEKTVTGRHTETSTAYTITFSTTDTVFDLDRKQRVHKERGARTFTRRDSRFVTDVEPIESVPVRCVQVEADDHLYLAGRSMIPTHNSCLAVDCARNAAIGRGYRVAIFSLEMPAAEIMQRILAAEARVPLQGIRKGSLRPEDWERLARVRQRVEDAPLLIDDSPNITLAQIRAKCRRLKQRGELDLVIIDYLQLMTSGSRRPESRQQEVSEFSRALKLLAKELELPVIALSQLNRGSEQRHDKKPAMSDLRESGSLEQDADIVLLIHREDVVEKESPRAGEGDFILAKHRNGPTDTVVVAFQGHYSRFVDMAT